MTLSNEPISSNGNGEVQALGPVREKHICLVEGTKSWCRDGCAGNTGIFEGVVTKPHFLMPRHSTAMDTTIITLPLQLTSETDK